MWLVDHGVSLNAFAKQAGIPQSSLHGYVKQGARIPVDAMAAIAEHTGLTIEYWIGDKPYPPPADELAASLEDALAGLDDDDLDDLLRIIADPGERERLLRIYRAAIDA